MMFRNTEDIHIQWTKVVLPPVFLEEEFPVTEAASETQTLDSFRTEMLRTRQQLRQVQLAERVDIDRLKAWLEFFDIGAVPILVALAALVVGVVRLERRKRRSHAA